MTGGKDAKHSSRTYILVILCLVYFCYTLDRNAIVVSQELWRKEFDLTDTQVGMITGTAYGISYGLAGIPLGWAADRFNQRSLLATLLAVWSALTVLCGLGTAYVHLLLTRIGVAAAESGGGPTSMSIIADVFPPERRASAASTFYASTGLGALLSFSVGAYVAAQWGWRALFILSGLPGLLLAAIMLTTMKLPRRAVTGQGRAVTLAQIPAAAWSILRHPILRYIYVGAGLYTLAATGFSIWIISFLVRKHGLSLEIAGTIVALGIGLFSIAGLLLGGVLADEARSRFGLAGILLVVAVAALVNLVFGLSAILSANLVVVILGVCGFGASGALFSGPTNAAISELAKPEQRGISFALFAVLANLVGSGIGPIAIGAIADAMATQYPGDQSLGPAMAIVLMLQLLTASVYWLGARKIGRPLAAAAA